MGFFKTHNKTAAKLAPHPADSFSFSDNYYAFASSSSDAVSSSGSDFSSDSGYSSEEIQKIPSSKEPPLKRSAKTQLNGANPEKRPKKDESVITDSAGPTKVRRYSKWADEDELVILKGILDYRANKGCDARRYNAHVLNSIRHALSLPGVSKKNLQRKIGSLRRRHKKLKKANKMGMSMSQHDTNVLVMADQLWGDSQNDKNDEQEAELCYEEERAKEGHMSEQCNDPLKDEEKRVREERRVEQYNGKGGEEFDCRVKEFRRVNEVKWADEDELVILRGSLEYRANKGSDARLNYQEILDSIHGALSVQGVTRQQLARKLKWLREDRYKKLKERNSVVMNQLDISVLEMADKLWGNKDNKALDNGNINDSMEKKDKKVKDKGKGVDVGDNVGVREEIAKEGEVEKCNGGGGEEFDFEIENIVNHYNDDGNINNLMEKDKKVRDKGKGVDVEDNVGAIEESTEEGKVVKCNGGGGEDFDFEIENNVNHYNDNGNINNLMEKKDKKVRDKEKGVDVEDNVGVKEESVKEGKVTKCNGGGGEEFGFEIDKFPKINKAIIKAVMKRMNEGERDEIIKKLRKARMGVLEVYRLKLEALQMAMTKFCS